jgi:hypothetical protein
MAEESYGEHSVLPLMLLAAPSLTQLALLAEERNPSAAAMGDGRKLWPADRSRGSTSPPTRSIAGSNSIILLPPLTLSTLTALLLLLLLLLFMLSCWLW